MGFDNGEHRAHRRLAGQTRDQRRCHRQYHRPRLRKNYGHPADHPECRQCNTVYKEDFAAAQTLLNPGFCLLFALSCGSVTATTGSFPFEANATVTNNCNITVWRSPRRGY